MPPGGVPGNKHTIKAETFCDVYPKGLRLVNVRQLPLSLYYNDQAKISLQLAVDKIRKVVF